MSRYMRSAISLAVLAAVLVASGCGGGGGEPALLESEKRLAGMYEACKTIDLTDFGNKQVIETEALEDLPQVKVDAVLKRSNGMTKPGTWTGPSIGTVLDIKGVARPFKELKIEAWDGYVGRIPYETAVMENTILADTQDGKPVPEEDGPVRLVVGSQDGFYWVRMITGIEVIR